MNTILRILILFCILVLPVSAMNISISPETQNVTIGSSFYEAILVDSGSDDVQAIDIDIEYPAGYGTAVSVTYGNLMGGYVLAVPTVSAGFVNYLIARTSGNATPVDGTLATIQIYASGLANVTIPFNITRISVFNTSLNELDNSTFNLTNGSAYTLAGPPQTIVENLNVASSIHDVQFILTNISNYRYVGYTVTGNDTAGAIYSGTTGDGGSVVFKMNSTQKANLRFVGTGVDINWSDYPIGYVYHVYVTGNGTTFYTVLITNTTLTNYTILYTNRSWSMQNLTSGYLNSTLGIGPMGQGVLIGLMSWVLMSAGGIVTVLLAMAVVSLLGLISWVLTLFIAMTVIALFVLLGGIGQSW